MTMPYAKLRAVDAGKYRQEHSCGCAYLFEPDGKGAWVSYHVQCCNRPRAKGKHRRKQPEKKAALPQEIDTGE